MKEKGFIKDFADFNKKILKRLLLYIIIILYLTFLVIYNYFRFMLNYSVEDSWIFGFITALISTISIVFLFDLAWFTLRRR